MSEVLYCGAQEEVKRFKMGLDSSFFNSWNNIYYHKMCLCLCLCQFICVSVHIFSSVLSA